MNDEQRIKRTINLDSIKIKREEGKKAVVRGTAIVFDQMTNIGGCFDEIIDRTACQKTDFTDVPLLVNHNLNGIPLARSRRNTPNSTLRLLVNERGLDFETTLDEDNNPRAKEILSALERGDISGMSFMASIGRSDWENVESDNPKRIIREIEKVYEISIVTFPAYEQTSVQTSRSDSTLDNDKNALERARESISLEKEKRAKFEKEKAQAIMELSLF